MKKWFTNRVLIWSVCVTATYFVAAYTVPRLYLFAFINGAFIGVMISVLIVFWPLFLNAWRWAPFNRVAQLGLGISLVWIAVAGTRVINIYYRVKYPELAKFSALLNNPLSGYFAVLALIGGILHVTGSGMNVNGRFLRGRKTLAICVSTGIIVSLVVTALQVTR